MRGRKNHGKRWAQHIIRGIRYRNRARRQFQSGVRWWSVDTWPVGHWKRKPVYAVHWQAYRQPPRKDFAGFKRYVHSPFFPVVPNLHILDAYYKVPPLLYFVPPIPQGLVPHSSHPIQPYLGCALRLVTCRGHKVGRRPKGTRAMWAAYIHFKVTLRHGMGMWPSWDPKHRTPVDPAT